MTFFSGLTSFCLVLSLFSTMLTLSATAATEMGGKTGVATPLASASEINYPPFSLLDRNGNATGFSVELLRSALAAMGREVTFRTGPWHQVRSWLEDGEVVVLPLVGRTPEREQLFDFTFPYMSLHGAIVVRQETTGIGDLDGLRGKQVAVMLGDNTEEILRRAERGLKIVTTSTFDEALHELSLGHHDAVIAQRLVALRLIQENQLTNLKIIDRPLANFRQDFCFAVREGDRETLALLNEGLALVMADGTYQRLHAKWFARYELPERTLVIGGDHNYPPYEFLDENNRPAGYNVDLTRAIAQAVGLDVAIRLGPWAEIRAAMERGEIDALQGMFYSPERDLNVDFTPAHTINHGVAVTRQGNLTPPTAPDQLTGLRLAVQADDIMHEFAEDLGLIEQIQAFDSQEEALRQVIEGAADVALVSRLTALFWKQKNDWRQLLIGNKALLSPEYCYAVPPTHGALLAQLGEGLSLVKESGEYRRIQERWMGIYEESTPILILKYVVLIAAPLLLVIAGFIIWSWSLRRQVAERTRALLRSTEFQRAMIACSPVALYSIDREGTVLTWNSSAERLFGWTEEEIVGRPLPIIPADRQEEFSYCQESFETSLILPSIEVTRRKKDGSLFDGILSLAPIRDDNGTVIGVMGAMEDISQRKRIEKAIEESEGRFRRAVEEAPFPIMMHAEDGQVLALSRGWLNRTGYSIEEITAVKDWTDRAYGAESAAIRRIIARAHNSTEARHEGRFTVTCKDGSQRIWEFSTSPLGHLPDGRHVAISMAADITDLLHAQQNIIHLNHVLRAVRDINQLIVREPVAITLIEKSCAVLTNSRGYHAALIVLFDDDGGPSTWAHAGKEEYSAPFRSMFRQGAVPPCCEPASLTKRVAGIVAESTACRRCFEQNNQTPRPSKKLLCAHLRYDGMMLGHLVAVLEGDVEVDNEERQLFAEMAEDLAYALYTLREKTEFMASERERVSLEQQLIQAQKMESVGRLAGGVAHDYNNMLGVIIGNAELVLARLDPASPEHEDVQEILSAARRSADITRQLLAFARRQTIAPRPIGLNEAIEKSLKMLRRLIGENIELIWHPGHESRTLQIDPVQMDQILTNLLVNARDAIVDTGTITIETGNRTFDKEYCTVHAGFIPGDFVMLAISDDGVGMTKDQLASIFEPFFTTKPLGEGTGLGLATVYGIVKQNGGFINVYSEPGEGTIFKIYFPPLPATDDPNQLPTTAPPPHIGTGETILVVEDDPAILKMTGKLLLDLGFHALLADSPERALQHAESAEVVHLLLTDVVMPRMNGAELAKQIMTIRPDIGIVFMSGYTANVIAHKGILKDNVTYLQKPFSKADLAATLRTALAGRLNNARGST